MENISKINLSEIAINTNKEFNFKANQEPCIVCQKPMNVSDKTKYVHMLTSGYLINSLHNYEFDSQGLFPIGNDCCKRLPKDFIFSC